MYPVLGALVGLAVIIVSVNALFANARARDDRQRDMGPGAERIPFFNEVTGTRTLFLAGGIFLVIYNVYELVK